ncbi:MAG: FtsQ-type POTRA domain-containing protein [Thermomicrobium sp.]|nr:FtsQ-type POTRA domain-containing protein [Thermomicrobium sp.]MDW7982045.1 FtsQ-type POTRA domain-containing protein [Thermomicrobium sp.]
MRRALAGGVRTGRLFALLLVIGGGVLLVGFLEGPQYRVRTVVVNGNRLTFAESIVRESGVLGQSVFRVDTQAVADRLARHPAIAAATVRALYPDSVVIDLVEREPASVWVTGGTSWLVDGEGRVIGDGEAAVLPHVQVGGDLALQPGGRVPRTVARALPVLTQRFADRLIQFEYRPADGLVVVFQGGERIVFGDAERLPEQLAVIEALVARGMSWFHLDLRDPDRPVLWQVGS